MIRWAARHPIVPLALVGIIFCLGLAAVGRMPVAYLFGETEAPLYAWLSVPGEPGREEILASLVKPLEKRLLAMPDVAGCSASVYPASAWFSIEIKPGRDMGEAAAKVRVCL